MTRFDDIGRCQNISGRGATAQLVAKALSGFYHMSGWAHNNTVGTLTRVCVNVLAWLNENCSSHQTLWLEPIECPYHIVPVITFPLGILVNDHVSSPTTAERNFSARSPSL